MGEAPAFYVDELQKEFCNSFDFDSKGQQTATVIGNKIYVIAGEDEESYSTVGIRIFDQSTSQWIVPTVLGTEPKLLKDHSAFLLNGNRILVVHQNASSDDCLWFLEVDTPFVREQKKNFEAEVVAWSKVVTGDAGKPVVITGPSGVGKGTLIAKLMKDFPAMFGFSVSHTTRAPREKEKNGVHYHFTDRRIMERDIKDGKFLEFASVHGNLYGTSIEAVEVVADVGKRCILDIDVQGARSVRTSSLEAIFIFVCPPSFEALEKRLRDRGTESEEQIQKRLQNAKAELEQGKEPGLFDHILINDDLQACYMNLKKLLDLSEDGITAFKSSPILADLPIDYDLSKINQKILINCGTFTSEKPSKDMFVLDLSSLKGGAPGRTRGINLLAIDTSAGGIDGVGSLSYYLQSHSDSN